MHKRNSLNICDVRCLPSISGQHLISDTSYFFPKSFSEKSFFCIICVESDREKLNPTKAGQQEISLLSETSRHIRRITIFWKAWKNIAFTKLFPIKCFLLSKNLVMSCHILSNLVMSLHVETSVLHPQLGNPSR